MDLDRTCIFHTEVRRVELLCHLEKKGQVLDDARMLLINSFHQANWWKTLFFIVYILYSVGSMGSYNTLLTYKIADSPKYCICYLLFFFLLLLFSAGQSSNTSVLIPSSAESSLTLCCPCNTLHHDYYLLCHAYYLLHL